MLYPPTKIIHPTFFLFCYGRRCLCHKHKTKEEFLVCMVAMLGGQYNNNYIFKEFAWKWGLVPRGWKCSGQPKRLPWHHVQTSNMSPTMDWHPHVTSSKTPGLLPYPLSDSEAHEEQGHFTDLCFTSEASSILLRSATSRTYCYYGTKCVTLLPRKTEFIAQSSYVKLMVNIDRK